MSAPRTLFHVVYCPDPSQAHWQALTEAPHPSKSLYSWMPGAFDGDDPPEPLRGAIWSGLGAMGDRVGFLAEKSRLIAGSVWRETRQGWLARRMRPLPGVLWTGDAETFDGAFGTEWVFGRQVLWALGAEARIPTISEDLMIAWTRATALDMPPFPPGVRLAIRSGVDGGMFSVFARSARGLEQFSDAFRSGLDWRSTTFQRTPEGRFGETLARLAERHAPPQAAPDRRWFRNHADDRTRR